MTLFPVPGYLAGILVGGTLIHCQDLLDSSPHNYVSICKDGRLLQEEKVILQGHWLGFRCFVSEDLAATLCC